MLRLTCAPGIICPLYNQEICGSGLATAPHVKVTLVNCTIDILTGVSVISGRSMK